ncbi:MAG: hypothetical protein Aurels2KO_23650 [Aureliella sp.]
MLEAVDEASAQRVMARAFGWLTLRLALSIAPMLLSVFILSNSAYSQSNVENEQDKTHSPEQLFEPRQFAVEAAESDQPAGTTPRVLNYRLMKPADYDPTAEYPLVIFLHGAGERGSDNTAQLKHAVANFCSPDMRQKYPCYVLAPQCPKDESWADIDWTKPAIDQPASASKSMNLVLALVDEMVEDAAIDSKRIYLTGLSMGGYGTWDAIARRPYFFAAAAPVCGGADLATASKIAHMPIWCFHGAKDRVVTVDLSRKMFQALKDAEGEPKYTEYPDAGHDSWTATYSDPEFLAWLFDQRLKPKPRQGDSRAKTTTRQNKQEEGTVTAPKMKSEDPEASIK